MIEKKRISAEELDSQVALALPNREMLLITIVITNLLNGNTVTIDVRDINVANRICANVIATGTFSCQIQ